MIQPYWYQEDCGRAIRRAREKGARTALFVMASGLGKTVTAAFDCLSFRKTRPKARVIYLCHQNSILEQAKTTFEVVHGNTNTFGFYHGTVKDVSKVDFLFASLQTMRDHKSKFRPDEFDYVIVDESHRTSAETYLDVIRYWKPAFLLGMTATPNRTDGQDIRDIFGREVYYLPLEEGLAQGLLAPIDYRLLTDEIQLKGLIETRGKRFSISKLNRTVFISKRDEEIVAIIQKNIRMVTNPTMIIFCESVKYCERLAQLMPKSVTLHSKVPAHERIIRLEMFRQGLIPTLLVVDVFNEGLDIPKANVLVFLRSTDSPIVFFQQLGRGLRLCEGKENVLVLDFVSNCERVKTVHSLWEEVKARRRNFLAKVPSGAKASRRVAVRRQTDPFLLNVDQVQFKEKALKIIKIVRRITDKYTREETIASLQDLAKKLGRSPTQLEVHRNREMPSLSLINHYFGNFSDALTAADLIPNQMRNVSKKELLQQLRSLRDELGRSPSLKDIALGSKSGKCACEPVFRKAFGSLGGALRKINALPTKYVGLSKGRLIEQLKTLSKKLGRPPKVEDVINASSRDEMASPNVIRNAFGSWSKALFEAGLVNKVVETKHYSNEDLISELKKAKNLLGKNPTTVDIERLRKSGKISPSASVFCSRFGSFKKALVFLGNS